MKRSAAREIAVQLGFAAVLSDQDPESMVEEFFESSHYESLAQEDPLYDEKPSDRDIAFIRQSVAGVAAHRAELDRFIGQYARGWRTERISRSAAAALRQAMYEILYMPDVPAASSIDEAVELVKKYEDSDVVAFVNGVLGGFYRGHICPEPAAVPETETEAAAPEAPDD